MSSRDFS